MKKFFCSIKIIALVVIVAMAGLVPAAAYCVESKQYIDEIIEYNLQRSSAESVQEWIDGSLTVDAGAGSEWYVIALSNHGEYDFGAYREALNGYLSANEIGSASSRLKYALTYIAIGDKTNPYINSIIDNSIGEQGIMSLVFGLHILNNGFVSNTYSVNELVDEILSFQHTDGGWSVTGEYGDVDVTAMTVQALAVYYDVNTAVKNAVDDALIFLSTRQLENGGYSAYGVENPESTAQVIIALSSLCIDVCDDSRFVKNGNTVFDAINIFQLSDGSFCHREGGNADSTATAQVLCATVAYENMINKTDAFYIFSGDKPEEDQSVTVAETTQAEETVLTEVAVSAEIPSDTAEKTTVETELTETESAEMSKDKSDFVLIVCITVAIVSVLACAVLLIKKSKFIVVVAVVIVAVVALVAGISADKRTDTIGSVTISINCDVIKDENKSYIPSSGVILEETEVEIREGDTVYDVLSKTCEKENILFSANMGYIEGINNVFEMDFGKSSGWVYFVNGSAPSVGCGSYVLADGDEIQWCYTCDLGKDLDINFKK